MKESENNILENKAFIEIFNKVVRENNIVEYYLLDESGCFLMLDATGHQVWLIIKPEEDINYFYELAKDDPEFPAETLKKLEDRKILTHFKTFKESTTPAHSWHFFLEEAQPLDKEKKYYYTIVKNDMHFQMNPADIKTYQEFLNQDQ